MADAHYLLGLCLREQAPRRRGAGGVREAPSRCRPGSIPAREELAELYRTLGRSQPTSSSSCRCSPASTATTSSGRSPSAWRMRAPGTWELAVLTLGNALERDPDQPLIYGALGQVWLETRARPQRRGAFEQGARGARTRGVEPARDERRPDAVRPRAAAG